MDKIGNLESRIGLIFIKERIKDRLYFAKKKGKTME